MSPGRGMQLLRLVAVLLALSLMIGEGWRSYGVGRPVMAWLDDQILGTMLIASAGLAGRETVRRRAFFSGVWGFAVGVLFMSWIGKLIAPEQATPGNFDLGVLTLLIGIALAVAVAGFAASILLPSEPRRG